MLQGRLAQSIFSLSACFSNEGKTVLCKGTMVRAFKSKSGGCNFSSGATESNNWILASYAQNSPATILDLYQRFKRVRTGKLLVQESG